MMWSHPSCVLVYLTEDCVCTFFFHLFVCNTCFSFLSYHINTQCIVPCIIVIVIIWIPFFHSFTKSVTLHSMTSVYLVLDRAVNKTDHHSLVPSPVPGRAKGDKQIQVALGRSPGKRRRMTVVTVGREERRCYLEQVAFKFHLKNRKEPASHGVSGSRAFQADGISSRSTFKLPEARKCLAAPGSEIGFQRKGVEGESGSRCWEGGSLRSQALKVL